MDECCLMTHWHNLGHSVSLEMFLFHIETKKQWAGRSQCDLAEMCGIGKTQVQVILKQKAEFLDSYNRGTCKNLLTWKWFKLFKCVNHKKMQNTYKFLLCFVII